MDRYISESIQQTDIQLPSQKDVSYIHEVIDTVSIALTLATTLAGITIVAKSKIQAIGAINARNRELPLLDGEIINLLSSILGICRASRVTIALLHGKQDKEIPELRSLDKKYYSIIWEAVEIGSAATMPLYVNTPISEVPEVFAEAMANDGNFVIYHKEMVKNEKLLLRMASIGNAIVYFRLMGSNVEGFFGIFSIQFSEAKFVQGLGEISQTLLSRIGEMFLVVEEKTRLAKDLKLANHRIYFAK